MWRAQSTSYTDADKPTTTNDIFNDGQSLNSTDHHHHS
jgi:hypothetical protein